MSPSSTLWVWATLMEAQPLIDRLNAQSTSGFPFPCYQAGTHSIVISGMGLEPTETAMAWINTQSKWNQIINCGIAGALNSQMTIGTIYRVRHSAIVNDASESLELSWTALEPTASSLPEATLVSSSEPIFNRHRKQQLSEYADLVDMEGAVIARHCLLQNRPCQILKIVSDDSEDRELLLKNLQPLSEKLADYICLNFIDLPTEVSA